MREHNEKRLSRRLRRFFSTSIISTADQQITLSLEESRHLNVIMRCRIGDHCLVVDGRGHEARAELIRISDEGEAVLHIREIKKVLSRPVRVNIHAYVAIPQRGKMDKIVEKAQELGVSVLTPIETKHTVVRMSSDNKKKVKERWTRIAQEAAKQSGALSLTEIREPVSMDRAWMSIPAGETIVIFHPHPKAIPFKRWFDEWQTERANLHYFMGPEGGFEEKEFETLCRERQAVPVSLGPTLLKVDTAFLAVASALRLMST